MEEKVSNRNGLAISNNQETSRGTPDGTLYELAIPNREVQNIVISRIMTSFKEDVHKILKYGIACRRKECRVMMEP